MRRRAEETQTDGALQLVALKDDGKMGRRLTTGVHLQGDRATTLAMGTRVLMFVERRMDSMCRQMVEQNTETNLWKFRSSS